MLSRVDPEAQEEYKVPSGELYCTKFAMNEKAVHLEFADSWEDISTPPTKIRGAFYRIAPHPEEVDTTRFWQPEDLYGFCFELPSERLKGYIQLLKKESLRGKYEALRKRAKDTFPKATYEVEEHGVLHFKPNPMGFRVFLIPALTLHLMERGEVHGLMGTSVFEVGMTSSEPWAHHISSLEGLSGLYFCTRDLEYWLEKHMKEPGMVRFWQRGEDIDSDLPWVVHNTEDISYQLLIPAMKVGGGRG